MKLKKRIPVGSSRTTTTGVLMGIISSFILTLALLAAITSLILNDQVTESASKWFILIVRIIAVFAGILIGTAVAKEKLVIVTGAIAAGYLALLLALGITLYDNAFQGFALGALSVLIGGTAGCLIGLKLQNKSRRAVKIKG